MQWDRPRLPPEILEQVVWHLSRPCSLGNPEAQRTLATLSLVSRAIRHWALQARYAVVIAPRHVREFRKWSSKRGREMIGYNEALFVGLDDVSKLTSTSAGWEAELRRLLQRLGPDLTHLSLWTSETRAVLRDPAQIRGPRFRTRVPIETMNDVIESTSKRRRKLERRIRLMKQGQWIDPVSRPLKLPRDHDEQQTKAEIAAAKERAKQEMPKWLQWELKTKKEEEVKRTYKAHLSTTVREYQHELDVQKQVHEAQQEIEMGETDMSQGKVAKDDAHLSCGSLTPEAERAQSPSSDSDDDLEIDWGCMPIKLSICPTLPLYEHENSLNFPRMTIWTRVEELDVYVSVPAETKRYLHLFSSLIASPLFKFRLSSTYASLLIATEPIDGQSAVNIAKGLHQVMSSEVLSSLLVHEFESDHKRMKDIAVLERAIEMAINSASRGDECEPFDDRLRRGGGLAASLGQLDHDSGSVKVKILKGNQIRWGKLKDRRQDFLNRSLGLGRDCWDEYLE